MGIRCLLGKHDYEKYGPGTSILGLIAKASKTAAFRHSFGPVNPSHESDIYDYIRMDEIDEGRLYDPDTKETHYAYTDTIHDRVCLRCGEKENKIEKYKRFLDHKAGTRMLLIRNREDRQTQARRLTNGC